MGTEIIIASVVSTVISVAASILLQPDTTQDDAGSDVTKGGTKASRNRVFGRCRASCTNTYSNVNDDNQEVRLDVFAIGGLGRLKAIHQVYIEDKPVFLNKQNISTNPNKANDGKFGSDHFTEIFNNQNVEMQFRNGAYETDGVYNRPERAMELAISNSDGEYTSEWRGTRVPQVAVKATRNIEDDGIAIRSSQYRIIAEVTGQDCYDPRTGGYSSSSNPALAILEVLRDNYYGMSISAEYIDIQSFSDTANWCEKNGLEINGEVNCNNSFADIIKNILSCFDGALVMQGGLIKLIYEDVEPAIYSLNEDDYLKDSFKVTEQSSSNYYNVVNVRYRSIANEENEDVYQLPVDITDTSDPLNSVPKDGFMKTVDVKMPLSLDGQPNGNKASIVNGPAKFIANRKIKKRLYQKQVEFDLDLIDFPSIAIGAVVNVNNEIHDWENKPFRVSNVRNSIDGDKLSVATITLDEYNSEVYAEGNDGSGSTPRPPDTGQILSPTNLQFDQLSYITSGYGTFKWQPRYFSQGVEYQVDYRVSTAPTYTRYGTTRKNQLKMANLREDTYDFRVRAIDQFLGRTSPWAELLGIDVSPEVVLPPVKNVTIDATTQDFVIKWDDMKGTPYKTLDPNEPDSGGGTGLVSDIFKHYQVDIKHGLNGAVVESFYVTDNNFTYTFEQNVENGLSRTITAEVYIVSNKDKRSQLGATSRQSKTNKQHGAVSGLDGGGELGLATIRWDESTEPDYKSTEIHMSTTSGFSPKPTTLIDDARTSFYSVNLPDSAPSKTWFYFRVGSYDVFDRNNIVYSPEIAVRKVTIDDLLPEFPDELTDIRNPNLEQTTTGEMIMNVASPDKKTVTGFGMYADNAGNSRFLVAADEFALAVGGCAEHDKAKTYSKNEKVTNTVSDTKQELYQAKQNVPKNIPLTNTSYWGKVLDNTFQVAFYVDSATETLYIRNAIIKDLDSTNIRVSGLNANRIDTSTLYGNYLQASSTIKVGSGALVSGMNGNDATQVIDPDNPWKPDGETPNLITNQYKNWRLWAGAALPHSAPFRVDRNGNTTLTKLKATGADVSGIIRCDQLIFNSGASIPDDIDNGNNVKTFRQSTPPSGTIPRGSIWYNTAKKNEMRWYDGTTWQLVDNTDILKAIQDAANAQATADGKIETFFQNNPPSNSVSSLGDLWFDTNDGNKIYRHDGSSWQPAPDSDIAKAIADAAGAQATADGKITTYYQSTRPSLSSSSIGDLWVDTGNRNRLYRFNGSSYIEVTDDRVEESDNNWNGFNANRPNPSTIQIKSDNYVSGSNGFAIDSSGNAEFNDCTVRGVLDGATGTFSGSVQADQIIGDVVSAIRKNANTVEVRSASAGSNTGTFGTIRITNARTYPRTLMVTAGLHISVLATQFGGNPSQNSADGYIECRSSTFANARSYTMTSRTGVSPSPNYWYTTSEVVQIFVDIPANTTGTITIRGHLNGGTLGRLRVYPINANPETSGSGVFTAQLFRNGGDLA